MADTLDTATGTIEGDVAQIQSAIYGREVRASIAEAISLLNDNATAAGDTATQNSSDIATLQAALAVCDTTAAQNATAITALQESVEPLEEMLAVPSGGVHYIGVYQSEGEKELCMHYADGTTSLDNPPESSRTVRYQGRYYTEDTDGVYTLSLKDNENSDGEPLVCGYKTLSNGTLRLFDDNGDEIAADADGDREQAGILYPERTSVTTGDVDSGIKGFLLYGGTKVYLQDLLDRLTALETAVAALQEGETTA